MKAIRYLSRYFKNSKLKTKLNLSFFILIVIPVISMSLVYYRKSSEIVIKNAEENVYKVIKNNNKVVDIQLKKIAEASDAILVDRDIYTIFNNMKMRDNYELVMLDKEINKILYKYFPGNDNVYSVHLATSYYTFGSNKMFVPKDGCTQSSLYEHAIKTNGQLTWIPTYDFADMYNEKEFKNIKFDYKYLFSAVKLINSYEIQNGYVNNLPENVERPVLIINFIPEFFNSFIESGNTLKESQYYIVNEEGKIIYNFDSDKIGNKEDLPWLEEASIKKSGITKVKVNGKDMIVCYDTSRVTGWISALMIPIDSLLGELYYIRIYIIITGLILILFCFVFANIISNRITDPIKKLLFAIKNMGQGKFSTKVEVLSSDEIGNLIMKFNEMDGKIQNLIEENYIRKIREKETEIMCLNIQLNPHFLYNTINIINWMAIEKNENEISKMLVNLSSMLRYTAENNEELSTFEEDFEWLKNYIYIMENRFEGKFTVNFNINSDIRYCQVPKLFLQPFIENSIVHGFELIETGGIINISGWTENNLLYFSIEDNGKGMDLKSIYDKEIKSHNHIGIKNVDKRIKLIYGEKFGIQINSTQGFGTKVSLCFPIAIKEPK